MVIDCKRGLAMRKITSCVVILLLFSRTANAADNYFQPAGGSGDWNNPVNWSLGRVPDMMNLDTARIKGGNICNIDSPVLNCNKLYCGDQGDAALNLYDGARFYVVLGTVFGYVSGTCRVNMYGGSFADYGISGDTGGWTGWGWHGNFQWYQEGGSALFYINHGYGPADCVVKGGSLQLTYLPTNNDATNYWNFYVASGGIITMDAIGGLQKFTVGICGTMKIKESYWSEFESRVTYLGIPVITTEGAYKVVFVTPDVDFDKDCEVNVHDFALFADQWLNQNCLPDSWCEGTDVDRNGDVGFNDFCMFTEKWLDAEASSGPAGSYYVATDGDDNNPGTEAQPFRTLEKARDIISQAIQLPPDGVTVYLRGGKYFRSGEFQLTSVNCGEVDKRITYRGYPGETVRVIGGAELNPAWFTYTNSSSSVWSRLDVSAKGNVMECNLGNHGITDWGQVRSRGYGSNATSHMELSFDREIMQLARWPNSGFETTVTPSADTIFTYTGTRPSRWLSATHPFAFGYWLYDWAPQYEAITNIDIVNSNITIAKKPTYGIGPGKRWYALNLIEELDMPGEYYVESDNGMLYFWPPSDISNAELIVSVLGENGEGIVNMSGADYITFRDMTFEVCRYDAFDITDCDNILIDNCIIRNTGNMACDISSGYNVDVQNCEVYGIGSMAFKLNGGNRATLISSHHAVQNNKIHDFSRWIRAYAPGVALYGCGHEVFNNHFYHAPHSAITALSQGGNNHIMRFNEFNDICYETDDAGVVMFAHDWGYRGNRLEYNFIHDCYSTAPTWAGVRGVYLDSACSSIDILSNVIYEVPDYAIFINGGRDTIINNNVIAKSDRAITASRWARVGLNLIPGSYYNYKEKIEAYNYDQPPWSTAYPKLAAIFNNGYDMALEPQGNTIVKNIGWGNGIWQHDQGTGGYGAFTFFGDIRNNIENQDPKFVDEASRNMALRDDSPAYTIPGFVRIPFERIGVLDRSKAARPNPSNGKTGASTTLTLYWAEAFQSTSRDIYFGTTFADINDANTSSASFKGNITVYEYTPNNLSANTTYYWRIDERNAYGIMQKGDVWSFTTGS